MKAGARKKGNKPSAFDMLHLDDTSESEVALDSLGSFFNHPIDTDYQQEDTGNYNFLRLRAFVETESPKSNPESKIFTSFSLSRSSISFEAPDS